MNAIVYLRKVVLKIPQAALATVVGVTQATVSRWEAGESSPSLDEVSRIRTAIRERLPEFDDRHFFEPPAAETAPESQAVG